MMGPFFSGPSLSALASIPTLIHHDTQIPTLYDICFKLTTDRYSASTFDRVIGAVAILKCCTTGNLFATTWTRQKLLFDFTHKETIRININSAKLIFVAKTPTVPAK